MSCTDPRGAWRQPDLLGPLPASIDVSTGEILAGRRAVSFQPRDGWIYLRVPCGKCDGCRADRAREWSIRAYHESTLHERNCFLTLTYEDAPPALVKSDLQNFFKRARHRFKFRYLACGEYGDASNRPHYHALIFGEDFLNGKIDISNELYTSEILTDLWGHGLVSAGSLTMASCCYVAGYVFKKIGDKDTFSLHSRRPGIGHRWLDRYAQDIVRTGIVTIDGKEYPVPKRYMVWEEEQFSEVRKDRAAVFDDLSFDERRTKDDQLPAKAVNQKSRLKLRSKSL